MVDPTTTNKGYAIPVRGTDVGTWDVPLNGNFDILDNNLGGVTVISLTNTNVILNASQYQCAVIRLVGTLTGNVTLTFPQVNSFYIIDNKLFGSSFYALITTGAVGGLNIATQPGTSTLIFTDGTDFKFCNLPPSVGTVLHWYTASMPAWVSACSIPPFVLCNGGSFSSSTYPYLNAFLGGTTLPDMRGRAMFMLDQSAGRLTNAASGGINGASVGNSGGEQAHQIILSEMYPHTHTASVNDPGHSHTVQTIGATAAAYGGTSSSGYPAQGNRGTTSEVTGITVTNSTTGSGDSHNTVPPGIVAGIVVMRAA